MSILINEYPNFTQLYRAEVKDNKDPLNAGRVKVYIPGLSDPNNIEVWARPMFGYGFKTTYGCWQVPPIGAKVYVFFENNQLSNLIYFGGVILNNETLDKAQIDGSQEKEYVILRTPNGNTIRISDNKNRIYIETLKTYLDIDDSIEKTTLKTQKHIIEIDDKNNQVKITCGGGQTITCHNNGNIDIYTNGIINIKGSNKNSTGVVTKECICAFTGKPHISYSSNVKATKL